MRLPPTLPPDCLWELTNSAELGIVELPQAGRMIAVLRVSAEESPHSKEQDAG